MLDLELKRADEVAELVKLREAAQAVVDSYGVGGWGLGDYIKDLAEVLGDQRAVKGLADES